MMLWNANLQSRILPDCILYSIIFDKFHNENTMFCYSTPLLTYLFPIYAQPYYTDYRCSWA